MYVRYAVTLKPCILLAQCVYGFCITFTTAIVSLYSFNRLAFVMETRKPSVVESHTKHRAHIRHNSRYDGRHKDGKEGQTFEQSGKIPYL
jgi:hypothetical protein